MLRSWQVLALHCFLLWLLVACSISSMFVAAYQPEFFRSVFVPVYFVTVVLTVMGWSPWLGGCALTKLENKLRGQEGKRVYDRTFLVNYLDWWVGVQVPSPVVTITLVVIMLFPGIVYLFG